MRQMVLVFCAVIIVAGYAIPGGGTPQWASGKLSNAGQTATDSEHVDLYFYVDTADKQALRAYARVNYGGSRRCASIAYIDAVKMVGKQYLHGALLEIQRVSPGTLLKLVGEEFYARIKSPWCRGTYTTGILPTPSLSPLFPFQVSTRK